MKAYMKRILVAVLLLLVTVMMPGCWNARELDTLSIVAGIAIDKSNSDEMYDFTIQIGKAHKKNGGDEGGEDKPYTMVSTQAKTMLSALEKMRFESSRQPFLHSSQVLVLSKELAEEGVSPIIDMFMRNNESRLHMWVVVSEPDAEEVLSTKSELEPITAVAIARMLENETGISKYFATQIIDVISSLYDQGSSVIVPIVDVLEGAQGDMLSLCGMALFHKDKMIGELNRDQTLGYVMAMGEIKDGVLEVPMENGTAVLQISWLQSSSEPRIENGQVVVDITIEAAFAIGELQGFSDMSIGEVYPKLQQAALETVRDKVAKTIQKTQKYGTDVYGFGTKLYRKYPKEWQTMKHNWSSYFSDAVVNVTVKGRVTNTGKADDSLMMRGVQ